MTTLDANTAVRSPGTRLALLGALVYLCEWVAIIAAGGIDVLFAPGTAPATVLAAYQGHSDAFAWASGWFGVVLLGRTLFATALAGVLRGAGGSGDDDALVTFGVLAMTVGVLFETAAYAIVAAAGAVADHGGGSSLVTALDSTGGALERLLWGATGAGVLALAVAMARSGRFPRALWGLGLVSGGALLLDGLAFSAPSYASVSDALQVAVPLLWVWMLWTAVLLWRRTAQSPQASDRAVTSSTSRLPSA
jgi:hypothetical protein